MNRLKQHYWLLCIFFILSLKANGTSIYNFSPQLSPSNDSTPLATTILGACNSRPAGLTCADAPLLCESEFPYCGTLTDKNTFPTPLSGCGSIENYQFIQIEAGSETIVFSVKASNCTGGLGGNGNGIQFRVFETTDCKTFKSKYCEFSQIVPGSTDLITVANFEIGKRYYIMMDGYTGDICEYSIAIESGKIGGKPSIATSEISGPTSVCKNATGVNYTVSTQASVSEYLWKVGEFGSIISTGVTPSVAVNWGVQSESICAKIVGSCGESDWTCQTVNVLDVNPTATKSGDLTCDVTSVTLNASATVTPNNATVTYEWFNSSNVVIGTSSSISVSQTGVYTLKAKISLNGSTCEKSTTVTVLKASITPNKPILQGNVVACENKNLTYTIVTPQSGIDKYNWNISNGTIVSGATTPSVSVTWNGTANGKICVNAENSCGISDTSCLDVVVSKKPSAVTISGEPKICLSTVSTYTTSLNEAGVTYQWTVPTGATIKKGQGTNSIDVEWVSSTGGQICVTPSNSCFNATQSCFNITVKSSSNTAPNIIGSSKNCPNSKAIYSITPQPDYVKYTWKIPSIATVIKTNNKDSIEVQWNDTGIGSLCIEVENECGVKISNCLAVEVQTGIDSLTITGPQEVCPGDVATYTSQKDPDAISYIWFVPTGATILSGRGSNSIRVRFGANAGNVVVQPIGGCAADKSTYIVSLKKAPDAPTSISGKSSICVGDIEKYSTTIVLGIKRYNWTLPAGATFIGSDSTAEVTVRWASGTGGIVSVKTQGECAESGPASLTVNVNAFPNPFAGIDETICGRQYSLKAIASVSKPQWTLIEKPEGATVNISDTQNPKSTVTVSKAGKYILSFNESNGICKASDTLVLTFKDAPQLTLVNDACNIDGTAYNISVNINSFETPFTFSGNLNGTISGNVFNSAAINDGSNYNLIIRDVNGCTSDTLKGKKTCPCSTQAAKLKDIDYSICYGTKGSITFQTTPIIDSNDGSEFVLHTGSKNQIGTVLQRSTSGEFTFDATKMQYGTTYFVHHIAGNIENGVISTTDRCYAVSNGVSIVFKDKITIGLIGDTTICANTNTNLIVKTADLGIFKITYTNQTQVFSINNVKNGSTIRVSPTINSVYSISFATDAAGCLAEVVESAKINIRPKPTGSAGVDKSVCDYDTQLNANVPPQYKVTWKSLSTASVTSPSSLTTDVKGLKNGQNIFTLTIKDSICANSQIIDSVSIFVPIVPKAINISLEMEAGDTIMAKVVEEAPQGSYSATRIDNPNEGRFDLFSNGQFTYIANPSYVGVVRFRFMICSELCTGICDTGEVRILIKPKKVIVKPIEVDVPNTITPNDDGKNDVWVIDNVEKFPSSELIIFNRWGDILYKAKPYSNNWNGSNQAGEPLPEGTYYYVLRLNINDGKILKGDITILR